MRSLFHSAKESMTLKKLIPAQDLKECEVGWSYPFSPMGCKGESLLLLDREQPCWTSITYCLSSQWALNKAWLSGCQNDALLCFKLLQNLSSVIFTSSAVVTWLYLFPWRENITLSRKGNFHCHLLHSTFHNNPGKELVGFFSSLIHLQQHTHISYRIFSHNIDQLCWLLGCGWPKLYSF